MQAARGTAGEILRRARTSVKASHAEKWTLQQSAEAPGYVRRRCPGGAFAAMGELIEETERAAEQHQQHDARTSSLVDYWHAPATLISRPTLRAFHESGDTFFEDRPHAAELQQSQVALYFSEALLEQQLQTEDAVVLDVGANIGVFAAEVLRRAAALNAQPPRVLCFEPIPATLTVLRLNLERYDEETRPRVVACALGQTSCFERFHVRRGSSHTATCRPQDVVDSGTAASSLLDDHSMAARLFPRQSADGQDNREEDAAYATRLYRSQPTETVQCEVRTLSEVIRAHNLPRIALLKVDAEGSELEVLQGVSDDDWGRIQAVVVEVHAIGSRVDAVRELLESQGLASMRERASAAGTGLRLLWAARAPWWQQR
ncbi:31-O-demethyl-FK506 methyltransferase FkbM [Diplonema papillatum]|nr:31-O-demethyl-FK506 methyltransferase FkbM [Diplonema papillatum]